MIWIDFVIGKLFSSARIREALARTLGVPEANVAVTGCIVNASASTTFQAEVSVLGGDFPLHVNLYVSGDQPPGNGLKLLESLSRDLSADILTADECVDPYSMMLVSPRERPISINLDVESIDEHNEYRLAAAHDDA